MSLQKILKVKSFDKRSEIALEMIREASPEDQQGAIAALFAACKYPAHNLSALALAIRFKYKETSQEMERFRTICDHPSEWSAFVTLLIIAGDKGSANQVFDSKLSEFSLGDLCDCAWAYYRFGADTEQVNRIASLVTGMTAPSYIKPENFEDMRSEVLEKIKSNPPKPFTRYSNHRFFLADDESPFDWMGESK